MPRVPGEQRFRLGERRELIGTDEALDGDRAQVDHQQVGPPLECLGGFRIERDAEAPRVVCYSEEHAFRCRCEGAHLMRAEQGVEAVRAALEHDQLTADRNRGRTGIRLTGREERCIAAPLRDARKMVRGIAEQGLRPEIGAWRHQELQEERGGNWHACAVSATLCRRGV